MLRKVIPGFAWYGRKHEAYSSFACQNEYRDFRVSSYSQTCLQTSNASAAVLFLPLPDDEPEPDFSLRQESKGLVFLPVPPLLTFCTRLLVDRDGLGCS